MHTAELLSHTWKLIIKITDIFHTSLFRCRNTPFSTAINQTS